MPGKKKHKRKVFFGMRERAEAVPASLPRTASVGACPAPGPALSRVARRAGAAGRAALLLQLRADQVCGGPRRSAAVAARARPGLQNSCQVDLASGLRSGCLWPRLKRARKGGTVVPPCLNPNRDRQICGYRHLHTRFCPWMRARIVRCGDVDKSCIKRATQPRQAQTPS